MTTATRGHEVKFKADTLVCGCGLVIPCAGLTIKSALALIKLHNENPRDDLERLYEKYWAAWA